MPQIRIKYFTDAIEHLTYIDGTVVKVRSRDDIFGRLRK